MLLTELSETLTDSIDNEEVVRFIYFSKGVPQLRTFSAYELSEDGETVLGYDHDRAALRRFDLGKIIDIETADEDYVRPTDKED